MRSIRIGARLAALALAPLLAGQDGVPRAADEPARVDGPGEPVPADASPAPPALTDPRAAAYATRIDALPFVAGERGVYLLSADLLVEHAPYGIRIASHGVVLDLGGHVLEGGLESGHGILAEEGFEGLVIRNGSLRHFAHDGIALPGCHGVRMEHVEVSNSGGHGIWLGDDARVEDCLVLFNHGGRGILLGARAFVRGTKARGNVFGGIYAGERSFVESCVAEQSTYGDGIQLGEGSVLRSSRTALGGAAGARLGAGSIVDGFDSEADLAAGLVVGPRASVRNANILATQDGPGIQLGNGAQAIECRVEGVFGAGFVVGDRALVVRCAARDTAGAGFRLGAAAVLVDAMSEPRGDAEGILVLGNGNLVRGSTARSATGVDFRVSGRGNVLLGNRARLRRFDVALGNLAPTVQGEDEGAPPWQNILE